MYTLRTCIFVSHQNTEEPTKHPTKPHQRQPRHQHIKEASRNLVIKGGLISSLLPSLPLCKLYPKKPHSISPLPSKQSKSQNAFAPLVAVFVTPFAPFALYNVVPPLLQARPSHPPMATSCLRVLPPNFVPGDVQDSR